MEISFDVDARLLWFCVGNAFHFALWIGALLYSSRKGKEQKGTTKKAVK